MSDNVSPIAGQQVATTGVDEQVPSNANGASGSGLTASSEVKSLEEFKKRAPEVYDKMMMGIATEICNKMKASQERLKQMWRDASDRAKGS